MGRRNYTNKNFPYIRRSVKQGLPTEVKHKGQVYKFATPLERVAIELHNAGKEILCIRIMKTEDKENDYRRFYFKGKPPRLVLDEFYYAAA
jgi:hypothetical protein